MGVTCVQVLQKLPKRRRIQFKLKDHGRGFSAGSAAFVDTNAAAGGDSADRGRSDSRGAGIQMDRAIRDRRADVYAGGVRSTSTLFEVNYIDDQKAYLTQSGQLYAEAIAHGAWQVYTFGPTFRAMKNRRRGGTDGFWMLERKRRCGV